MVDLTKQQLQDLQTQKQPARIRDPQSDTTYVLVRSELYDRLKNALLHEENEMTEDMFPHVMEVFGPAGWDDPSMDVYNHLDPRRKE